MKTALITGAGRGLGKEMARQLFDLDWTVYVTTLGPMTTRFWTPDHLMEMDVTSRDSIKRMRHFSDLQSLDLLINNAGIYPDKATILDVDELNLLQSIQVNAIGPLKVTQEFWDLLVKSKGTVLNISTIRSLIENATGANYFLSKNMLNNISALFKAQGEKDGVRVEIVYPETFKSHMSMNVGRSIEEAAQEILAKVL